FKPSNVLIDRKGRVAVTDFGLAVSTSDSDGKRSGFAGTPVYMAPEQHALEPATEARDQFAFCVALWEALFGRHPFQDELSRGTWPPTVGGSSSPPVATPTGHGPARATVKVPRPRRGHGVPARVVAALRRGLALAPADRWPSMDALLAELAPRRRRHWMWAVPALLVAGTLVAAVALGRHKEASCRTVSEQRVALAWNPAARAQLRGAFAATGLPAAGALADRAIGVLDRYAEDWIQVSADGCTGRAASAYAADAYRRRQTCLDHRLQSLRGVLAVFQGEPNAALVGRAEAVVATLPAPDQCTNDELGETLQPPPAIAATVSALYRRLAEAEANVSAGRISLAADQLASLRADVRDAGWVPLRVRVDLAAGLLAMKRGEPAVQLLTSAAQDATANHLDLVATRAWASALTVAGSALDSGEVELLAGMARAQAQRTGDPVVIAATAIAEGRAISRLGHQQRGEALCREASRSLPTSGGDTARRAETDALVCIAETLGVQERWPESEAIARTLIERWSARNPTDHPTMADYLHLLGNALAGQRRADEARRAFEQSLEIRRRSLGAAHPRTIAILDELAQLHIAANELDQAEAMLREAIALISPALANAAELPRDLHPANVLATLHRDLGTIAGQRQDAEGARDHLARAAALTREVSGERSPPYAALLLSLSQYQGATAQLDDAIASNRTAREIFLAHGDTSRATLATAMLGTLYAYAERWADARPLLEETIGQLPPSTDPHNRGVLLMYLARAHAHAGARDQATTAARDAERALGEAGPASAPALARLRAWMKNQRIASR
ncbi:MAG: tetratricopeptide repeat protein, partial [Kofleriaceae bacterium]